MPAFRRRNWLVLLALVLGAACSQNGKSRVYDGVLELDQRLLGFEVGGRVLEVSAKEGSRVEKGTELARLDDTLERSQRPVFEADLAKAEANLKLLVAGPRESEIRSMAEQLAAASAQAEAAEREVRRQRPLVEKGVLAQAAIDDLETKLAEARATRDSIAQKLRTLKEGSRPEEILAASAARDAAAAGLASLDERLSHYVLEAAEDGRVLDVMAHEGEVVSAGTPVVLFATPRRPFVDLFVPVGELEGLKVDQPAVVFPDGSEKNYRGKIDYISSTTEYTPRYLLSKDDRTSLVTRVRVRLADPEEELHAGVPCRVELKPSPAGPPS